MNCSPPGSSVHGILQARILEWVAILPPGDLPTQGWNLCLLHLLHWQAGSLPLAPSGKPLYAEYTKQNAGLDESQSGIKITGRNISNLRYADDTALMAES